MDVETAELLLLPFAGDGKRPGNEVVERSPHHTAKELKIQHSEIGDWRKINNLSPESSEEVSTHEPK